MDQGEGRSTVKGLLAEIKDSSELMIDLAYASVFFADSDLAKEVARLEERMFDDLRALRKLVILAARSPEDAEHMAGVLEIASAVEKIADPAENIAHVVAAGDALLVKGPEDGVALARELMGAPALPDAPEPPPIPLSDLDRAVDLLVEMKNSAEVAVGLAYSALLFNDQALAAEVGNLEARSDAVHDELESWVLRSSPEARNTDDLRGLLHLAHASEMIFDSAREMTRLVEQGEELHPVIAAALVESDEVGHETIVQ